MYDGVRESIKQRMEMVGREVGAIEGWEENESNNDDGDNNNDKDKSSNNNNNISNRGSTLTMGMGKSNSGSELLKVLEEKWKDHKLTLVMVRDILMYLDRTYVLHSQPKKKPVYDLGLSMFRTHVWSAPRVSSRAKSILLHNVFLERSGLIIDRSVMKGISGMLVEIGGGGSNCYENDFQRGFLNETREFYKKESNDFLQKNTVPEYEASERSE